MTDRIDATVIIVCGGRDAPGWSEQRKWVRDQVMSIPGTRYVMHGAASGADFWMSRAAARYARRVVPRPADWKRYGKAAGPIRNKAMLEEALAKCQRVVVLAAPGGRGTAHMVSIAEAAGVEVRRCPPGTRMKGP